MNTSEYRQRNLYAVIKWLRGLYLDRVQIIVAEQGSVKSKIKHIDNHIFYKNTGLFHKSKILNDASFKSKSDKLIFADNDIILDEKCIKDMINALDTYEAVNPYDKVLDLSEECTNKFISNFEIVTTDSSYRQSIVFAGGVFGMQKRAFNKIAGFDEGILGWGGEDDTISHKIHVLCNKIELISTCYHLYHDRNVNGMPFHEHYDENVNLVIKIRSFSDSELVNYCLSVREKFEKIYGKDI
jgi:predicted glycosyltransferase involved in capsule biosynthesis